MRSLFDDTKNPLFRLLCQIINEIHAGAKYTRKEIIGRILSLPEFIYLEAPEKEREEQIVDTLFNFDHNGFAKIPEGQSFSLPPSDTELYWLSAMLADEELSFLLPVKLREKLTRYLEKFPPLYEKNFWRRLRVNETSKTGEKFSDELSTIVTALRLQRKISCGEKLLTPCRLEYDLSADKYHLIVWREETRTIEKISVETLEAISLSEEIVPPDCDALLRKFYNENIDVVSFKVRNTRNAVERCFALFSSFDKKARLQDDGTYLLTVSYCSFDEEEVFEKVFSLGATVTVIEPKKFQERIIRRLTEIKELYK